VPLYVRKGLNEIFLMVTGRSDRWAFRAGTSEPLTPKAVSHGSAVEVWATADTFLTPESVLKDPERDILYVTSFDNEYARKPEPSGYISRLSLDGEILDHRWVDGLHAPTGMDAWRDTLYVAEREHLLAIDLATGAIAGRWAIPDPVFPNDLVIDDQGTVYISDTRTDDWADSRIYRFKDGRFDVFANEGISRANGLWIRDGWLLVGSSGDGLLKRVELSTGRVETVVSMGAGIIDGIRVDREGNFLLSHWEGQLYRISPQGDVVELLDALPEGWNTADFEYLPEEGLILIPTFLDNRVRGIRIGG
jgi:sugar lactone lactonase YvrE